MSIQVIEKIKAEADATVRNAIFEDLSPAEIEVILKGADSAAGEFSGAYDPTQGQQAGETEAEW